MYQLQFGIGASMTGFWQTKQPHRNLDWQIVDWFMTAFQFSLPFNVSQWSKGSYSIMQF